jgi:hypothetical protein
VIPALIVFLAAQASSPTPTGTPTATPATPTPIPKPTPVAAADPYRPRGLSEIARERRLGRLSGSGAAVVTTPEPEPVPSGSPPARRPGPVRVEDVQDNGAVTDGTVSVYGTVRNTGRAAACRVRIFLRLYDDHGVLLSTGETTTDLKIVGPGEAVAFGGIVKAPAGLRGSRERKPDPLVDGTAATNWQRVGRVEAEITGVSEECS